MKPPTFLALTADLDGSRELEPEARRSLQGHITKLVQENMTKLVQGQAHLLAHRGGLRAGPELVGGDEVQALFLLPSAGNSDAAPLRQSAEIVMRLILGLAAGAAQFPTHRVRFTFGMGIGSLSTLDPSRPLGMIERIGTLDGPCFHRAQRALAEAKKDGLFLATRGFPPAGGGDPGWPDANQVVAGVFNPLGALITGWTSTQADTVLRTSKDLRLQTPAAHLQTPAAKLQHDVPRTEVAAERGVTAPNITKALQAASYRSFQSGMIAATAVLAWKIRQARES